MVPNGIGSREDLRLALEAVLNEAEANDIRVTGSFRCENDEGTQAWETLITELHAERARPDH